jgi:uncharacterized protein (DUF1778 family)
MHQRTRPSVKASIEAAADLMGIEASAFVVMAAQALLAALDEASAPTPAMQDAWRLHQQQVARS